MEKNDKPYTNTYFSTEIKSLLSYYNLLEDKLNDLNKQNKQLIENLIDKYYGKEVTFEAPDFAIIRQVNMLFSSVMSDIQATIVKIDYCHTIAVSGFGLETFDLTDKERQQFEAICNSGQSCLFMPAKDSKGNETVKIKDEMLFDIIKQRSHASVPKDQKQLKELFNIYLVSYNEEKKREEKIAKDLERQRKQAEEAVSKDLNNGKEVSDTTEAPNTEG